MDLDVLHIGVSGSPLARGDELLARLSPYAFHDSAAASIGGRQLILALEEERLSRTPHTNEFPRRSIMECLRRRPSTTSRVQFHYYFTQRATDMSLAAMAQDAGCDIGATAEGRIRINLQECLDASHLEDELRLTFHRHHDCHAAFAMASSQQREGLVVVLDGNGDAECASVFRTIDRTTAELVETVPVDASIGYAYRAVTHFLGLGRFGEYKLMGLAAYSDDIDVELQECLLSGEPAFLGRFDHVWNSLVQKGYRPVETWTSSTDLTSPARLAATIQRIAERAIFDIVEPHVRRSHRPTLTIAGGVGLNGLAAGRLAARLSDSIRRLHVPFAAGDSGTAIGAALLGAQSLQVLSEAEQPRRRTTLLAPPISILTAQLGLPLEPPPSMQSFECIDRAPANPVSLADDIVNQLVVGYMSGRSEFGPRALGGRSILASPEDAEMRSRLNGRVKGREAFRPFAPLMREVDAATYLDLPESEVTLSFMSVVLPSLHARRPEIPAAIHVDGTCRPQLITRTEQSFLYETLTVIASRNRPPVLVNTSFNRGGDAMVETFADGLTSLVLNEIDVLYYDETRWSLPPAFDGSYLARFHQLGMTPQLNVGVEVIRTATSDIIRRDGRMLAKVPSGTIEAFLQTPLTTSWTDPAVEMLIRNRHINWNFR